MPEEVSYDRDANLIRVRAWGVDNIQTMLDSRNEVMRLAEKHQVFAVLVDVRELEVTASILDIFDFGQDFPPELKTALLAGEDTNEDVLFVETVAVNRSRQMQVFYDEDEAMRWLGR